MALSAGYRSTSCHGLSDLGHKISAPPGHVRKPGSGRKKVFEDPTLAADLKELVEPASPLRPIRGRTIKPVVHAFASWTGVSM